MSDKKRIKDTKLGKWLSEKAEDVLNKVREEKKKARDIEDYIERGRTAYELQEAPARCIKSQKSRNIRKSGG